MPLQGDRRGGLGGVFEVTYFGFRIVVDHRYLL